MVFTLIVWIFKPVMCFCCKFLGHVESFHYPMKHSWCIVFEQKNLFYLLSPIFSLPSHYICWFCLLIGDMPFLFYSIAIFVILLSSIMHLLYRCLAWLGGCGVETFSSLVPATHTLGCLPLALLSWYLGTETYKNNRR